MFAYDLDGDRVCLAMPCETDTLGDAERGLVHTGALTALIDSSCGMAVLHKLPAHEPIATLDLRVDYLRATPSDRNILCWAWCHRVTPNVAFTRAEVFLEGSDEPVAVSSGSFMRLKPVKKKRAAQ